MGLGSNVRRGLVAGAAGTMALNGLTYLDMAVRGRPASQVPAQTARTMAEQVDLDLTAGAGDDAADNRSEGLGALMGFASGLGFGALYGAMGGVTRRMPAPAAAGALTVAVMAGSNAPPTMAGITDPRLWDAKDWIMDLLPHLAYGFVTAMVFDRIARSGDGDTSSA